MATATSPTAASLGVDWSNRHAIDMARIEAGQVANVQALLGKLETKLAATLMDSGIAPGKAAKLQAIHKAAADAIGATYGAIAEQQELALGEVAGMEAKAAGKLLNAQVGADIFGPVLTEKQWSKVANETLIFGHSSGAWWKSQDEALRFKFQGAMQEGYALGESVDEMVRRLRGTKANGYKDGIMSASRREAEALVRSSVQTISNAARLAGFEEQSDIIKGVQWVSTLDTRTTPICQALNGLTWRLPDYEPVKHTKTFPGPTAHWNCRSTQVAVLRSWAELSGKPIQALDGATLQAKLKAKLAAKGMDPQQVAAATARSQASMDGQVPASLDFQTWLEGKPDAFALDLLGPGRFAMWKAGKITTRDLTDQNNRPLTIAQLQAAIDGDGFPVETEGIEYLPPEQPTPKYVAEAIQTAADLQAAGYAAAAKIADILANPKGQTLKAAALAKLQKEQPDLTPSDMLAMAEGIAAEKQAAASKASVLSQAKKKLVAGEQPTPAQWKLLNDLPEDEKNTFLASVEEGKKASSAGIYAELDALIDATGGKLSASEMDKLALLPAEQATYLNGKIIAAEQDATVASIMGKFSSLNELAQDPDASAKYSKLPIVLKNQIDDHLIAKFEAKKATDQIAEWEASADPLKVQAMKQAKDAAKGLTLPASAIAEQAEFNLTSLQWDALAQAVAGPNATKLKQAAFQKTTGLKPDFSDLESFKEWMIDNVEPTEAGQILNTVTTEAAAKQAAASKASKLSTAKQKLLQGKKPSPSEQAVIDSLTPEEKTSWQESVKQAQTLQAAPVVGLKVQVEETTLDSKKGLAALKKQPDIAGTDYEDWLDYLTPDELKDYKVNALPMVDMTPEWEAGEVATLLSDSDKAALPNQITKIPLKDAITTQVYVKTPDVEHYLKTGKTDSSNPTHLGKPPLVVKLDGKYQVHDGNHRANAYLLAGETELPALVYDLDAAIATDPKNPTVQKIFGGDPPADIVAKAKAAYANDNPAVKAATKAAKKQTPQAEMLTLFEASNDDTKQKILDALGLDMANAEDLDPPIFKATLEALEADFSPQDFSDALGEIKKIVQTAQTPAASGLVDGKAVMQTSKALWAKVPNPALVETIKAKLGFDPTIGAANIGEVNAGLAGWAKSSGKDLGALLAEAKAEVKAAAKQASKTATATKPDVKAANLDLFIPDPSDLVKVKDLSGSTRPILAKDPTTGKQWVVKSPEQGGGGPEHLRNEAAADAIYRIAGVPVPGSAYVEQDGKHYKVAEFLEGAKTLGEWERTASPAEREAAYGKIREHFVMDALMGNWDVAGQSNDNIMVMPDGTPVRVDNGGALDWRAMGSKKTASEWKATVDELKTLRDPSQAAGKTAQIFAGISQGEIHNQIAAILAKRDDLVMAVMSRKGKEVADVFAKRIAYLEKQLPAAMRKPTPAASKALTAAAGTIPKTIAKDIQAARVNGVALPIGTSHVEDMQALTWAETDAKGKPVTVTQMKVTDEGNAAIQAVIGSKLGSATPVAAGGPITTGPVPDPYLGPWVAMAKTLNTHKTDGAFNAGTMATFKSEMTSLEAKLKALKAKPIKTAAEKAEITQAEHYLAYGKQLEATQKAYVDAALKGTPVPATAPAPPFITAQDFAVDDYQDDKPKKAAKAAPEPPPADFTVTRADAFKTRLTEITAGNAKVKAGTQKYEVNAGVYTLSFPDGTTVTYVPRTGRLGTKGRVAGLAFEGTVQVRIPADADHDTVMRTVETLQKIGIDTTAATADYRELVWLKKTAYQHNDQIAFDGAIAGKATPQEQIAAARAFIEKAYKVKVPKRGEEGYTADGGANSFGHGTKHVFRADLPPARLESEMGDYALMHSPSTSFSMAEVLGTMLETGGEATPTTARIRKGVDVSGTGGWSAASDIRSGGADFFFTRIRKKDRIDGRHFAFKIRNLGRADAVSYSSDVYGETGRRSGRVSTIAQYKNLASKEGSDETILKGGMFLLDEIDRIVCRDAKERNEVLAMFRKHKVTHMTDGRPIEQVAVIK